MFYSHDINLQSKLKRISNTDTLVLVFQFFGQNFIHDITDLKHTLNTPIQHYIASTRILIETYMLCALIKYKCT